MLVPSIDIQNGQAVQLVGGETLAIEAGSPLGIAERFSRVGEIAVIDLDAALARGSNAALIRELVQRYPCRVGGGIRTLEAARAWLDAGAQTIILGTCAGADWVRELPRERIIAAVDARDGEVVVEGWTTRTGRCLEQTIVELRDRVGGFLVTFVEREGRLGGTDLERARALRALAPECAFTFAGGITEASEIASLDAIGADAQVGMALYTGQLPLAEAFIAPVANRDGLWPTVVTDPTGAALGLVWSNTESLAVALEEGRGVYWSRRRGLWRKGESSGATQSLIRIDLDCDRDALRFTVEQAGTGFCHLERWTCWGAERGLTKLEKTLERRKSSSPVGSYSARLYREPNLLAAKLREEAAELAAASESGDRNATIQEAADVAYFLTAALVRAEISWSEVSAELDRRALRVSRRPGHAKPQFLAVGGAA